MFNSANDFDVMVIIITVISNKVDIRSVQATVINYNCCFTEKQNFELYISWIELLLSMHNVVKILHVQTRSDLHIIQYNTIYTYIYCLPCLTIYALLSFSSKNPNN